MRRASSRGLALVVVALSVAGVTRAVANAPDSGQEQAGKASPAPDSSGSGYWLIGSDGSVSAFGVPDHGSLGATPPARPITGGAAAPGGDGYWLVGTDGGVFSFGDAGFFGSTGAIRLNKPIVGMASTPSGTGYWLVASDGGVFAFGDASFHGSTGAMRLNRPIVGLAASPTGEGYWLVASDGGVFAFGDAGFFGSTGAIVLNKPITGMSASPSGRGYRFVASDGGLFSFGDAAYAGSAAGRRLGEPIIGVAGSPAGNGYWLAGAAGTVYGYGDVAHKVAGASDGRDPQPVSAASLPAPVVAVIAPPHLGEGRDADITVPTAADGGSTSDPSTSGPSAGAPPSGEPTGGEPGGHDHPGRFRIALIGDTGYTPAEDQLLLKTRTAISSRPYAFVVHDGDVKNPLDPCTGQRLAYVRDIFDGFSIPFVYTPGDNEWSDCPDPGEQLAAIRQRFFAGDHSLGQRRIVLTRQAAPFVENARWVMGNVVFATLNVPGPSGRDSRADGLSAANVRWLDAAFDTALAQNSPGVMIIWQDDPLDSGSDDDLMEAFLNRARRFARPVVLVHGDTHVFRLDKPWGDAPNVTELETFALDNTDWWVEVSVDPAGPEVFSFEKEQS